MHLPIIFSKALAADAQALSRLIDASIRLGCVPDHGNDPQTLADWLSNKSPAALAEWIDDAALAVRVARCQGRPIAVAIALRSGEICQCHVAPEYARQGLGRAVVSDLESQLQAWGLKRATLYSTGSAQGFFHRLGYRCSGAALLFHGLRLRPMEKTW